MQSARSFVTLARTVAARRVAVSAAPARQLPTRCFSSKAENMSIDDIMAHFHKIDQETTQKATKHVPIRLSGLSGQMATELFTELPSKSFAKVHADLQGLMGAINDAGVVVARFFGHNNYTPEECKRVMNLLLSESLPAKFDDIKDLSVQRVIVAKEENLPVWKATRAAVKALKLSPETSDFLGKLADRSRLDLMRKVVDRMTMLNAAMENEIAVTVVSAQPLSKGQADTVKKAIPGYVAEGQKTAISFEVDDAVLGGLMLKVGQSAVDLTVQSQLVQQMSKRE